MIRNFTRLAAFFILAVTVAACARVNIKDGMQAHSELRHQDAIHHLSKGLEKIDDLDARRALASSLTETNRFSEAREQFQVLATSPNFTDADRIAYGRVLMSLGNYSDAEEVFNGILSREPGNQIAQALRNSSKKANDIRKDSLRYEVTPMFTSGLTAAYSPVVSGNKIYFSGARDGSGEKDAYTGLNFTDLYVADIDGANFNKPAKVEGVNGRYHDGIAAISGDGKTMILTRSNYGTRGRLEANDESINTMQLYSSTLDDNGKWSTPELLPFCNGANMYAHPALSSDGKTLYFSSDMAGGYGGMDLYTVTQTDGVWSNPQNLGATVNTMGNELFPTLRSDDSLYFSSNAHQTLGGLDILYSVYRNGDWNAPTHLPYPVNTQFDDFGMAFTNDGTTGFFSSDRSGRDGIYSFISNDDFFNLSGLVTRKFDGSPLEGATITLTNLTDGTEEVFITDELGMFENVLLPGKDYRVKVEKEGFFNVNETVSTRNPDADRNVALNIELLDLSNPDVTDNGGTGGGENGNGDDVGTGNDRLPKGVNANNPYQVPNIFWDYDKADIREDARPYLDYVAKLLKDNPQLKVEVSSHCDSRGGDFYNDQLSDRRARAVTEYLVKKGVKRSMLLSKGYGKRKLLNRCSDGVNCSEEEHQVNRRTEFKVLN